MPYKRYRRHIDVGLGYAEDGGIPALTFQLIETDHGALKLLRPSSLTPEVCRYLETVLRQIPKDREIWDLFIPRSCNLLISLIIRLPFGLPCFAVIASPFN